MVDYTFIATNMLYNLVIQNFEQRWKALKDCKENDNCEVPKISKLFPRIKWTEAFSEFLNQTIGVRTIPLTYLIRGDIMPSSTPPLLLENLIWLNMALLKVSLLSVPSTCRFNA